MEDSKQNRDSWLKAGFEQLAAHGPQGLRIMTIAEQIGVTKGSFYWHFADLREYRVALLAEWERRYTQQIIEQTKRGGGDVAARLRALLSAAEAASNRRLTFALRSWASVDPMVAEAMERVDELRVNFVASLLRELGWARKDANTLARFAYEALMGRLILPEAPLSTAQLDLILSTLTPK